MLRVKPDLKASFNSRVFYVFLKEKISRIDSEDFLDRIPKIFQNGIYRNFLVVDLLNLERISKHYKFSKPTIICYLANVYAVTEVNSKSFEAIFIL